MASSVRSEAEIIRDIESQVQSPGYLFCFCIMVWTDLGIASAEEVLERNPHEHLSNQELSFVLGLMAKSPIILGDPPSQELAAQSMGYTRQLMEELQGAHMRPDFASLPPSPDELESWLHSGPSMVEAIFYGEEGAYPWQYLGLASRRYKRDDHWIRNYLGASLETMVGLASALLDSMSLRSRVPHSDDFESFCSSLLDVFCFSKDDVDLLSSPVESRIFLDRFSLVPGTANQRLTKVGAFNELLARPIIELQGSRYILPLPLNLSRAVYENPYYWMKSDSKYETVANENRGTITEDICEELLVDVFGTQNVHRNVQIRKDGKDITDIDILVVYRNKALIVQAKSKRLTEASKIGDISSLQTDFQKAIQSAYDQAVASYKAVLDGEHHLISADGQVIRCEERVNECFVVCVTADYYPAAILQVESYLHQRPTDPNPVVISLFDLDTIKDFLPAPLEMLYYVRQRSRLFKKIIAISEMDYLGFHMDHGLPTLRQVDLLWPSAAKTVDAELIGRYMEGVGNPKPATVIPKWQTNALRPLIGDLKMSPELGMTDAIFWLYDLLTDLDGGWANKIEESIRRVRGAAHRDGEPHTVSWLPVGQKAGLSLLCYPNAYDMAKHLPVFCKCKKYSTYSNEWLALGFLLGSSASFDLAVYTKGAWEKDPELARASKVILKGGTAIGNNRSISKPRRNDPCPCDSGKKFKKCHGFDP